MIRCGPGLTFDVQSQAFAPFWPGRGAVALPDALGRKYPSASQARDERIGLAGHGGSHNPFIVDVAQTKLKVPSRLGHDVVVAQQIFDLANDQQSGCSVLRRPVMVEKSRHQLGAHAANGRALCGQILEQIG